MPHGIHVYPTVVYKGGHSSVNIDLPVTGVITLTVAEALVYANGLAQDNPVTIWLRGEILRTIQHIRDLGGEE